MLLIHLGRPFFCWGAWMRRGEPPEWLATPITPIPSSALLWRGNAVGPVAGDKVLTLAGAFGAELPAEAAVGASRY
jgi:hypothetical protein